VGSLETTKLVLFSFSEQDFLLEDHSPVSFVAILLHWRWNTEPLSTIIQACVNLFIWFLEYFAELFTLPLHWSLLSFELLYVLDFVFVKYDTDKDILLVVVFKVSGTSIVSI
jgi:hypothetical protein